MLAQNLKTAADLGITGEEFGALVKLLGMLEREEIPHEPNISMDGWRVHPLKAFNLASWRCDTAACLGGWAESIGAITFTAYGKGGIHRLFFPDDYDDEIGCTRAKMMAVTPAQAAIALRSYLTTGEPRWREAVAE